MRCKSTLFICFFLALFLFLSVACNSDDDDDDPSFRKDDDLTDDDLVSADDDTSSDDDDDQSDDEDFWPEDDDYWFDPDDDANDDNDDDDDDINPFGPGVIGWVVGENSDADEAFIGFVSGGRVARRPLSASGNIRLHAIDMNSDFFGFSVGFDYEKFEGVVIQIHDDVFTKRITPAFDDAWGLEDVALHNEDLAYMVGFQVVGAQMQGVILKYDGNSINKQIMPEIAGAWQLSSVAIATDFEAWAVGRNDATDQPVILRYNGFNWYDYSVPTVGEYAQLNEVAADSLYLAIAVGGKRIEDDTKMRPFALTYEGSNWIETWNFAGDGVEWQFHNLDILSEDKAFSYAVKNNHLESWTFNGTQWQSQVHFLTLPEGSVIESNSMYSENNGLLGVRNNDGRTGLVIQKYNSIWEIIEDVPTSLGCIYDVIALDKE